MKYTQRPIIKQILFTKKGLEKFEKEKEELLLERPNAVKELSRAREMGDLSENGFYKGARAKVSQIDSRLRHLTYILKSAKIIEEGGGEIISIGNTVILSQKDQNIEFSIVGEYEANPSEKKISHLSPIGRGLIGKKVGETVKISTPAGEATYIIQTIR